MPAALQIYRAALSSCDGKLKFSRLDSKVLKLLLQDAFSHPDNLVQHWTTINAVAPVNNFFDITLLNLILSTLQPISSSCPTTTVSSCPTFPYHKSNAQGKTPRDILNPHTQPFERNATSIASVLAMSNAVIFLQLPLSPFTCSTLFLFPIKSISWGTSGSTAHAPSTINL